MKIIQISDPHLYESKKCTLDFDDFSINTHQSFQAVSNCIKQVSNTDLIVLTGDITQEPTEKTYQRAAALLQKFTPPTYCLAGNHDNPNYLQHFLNSKNVYSRDYLDKGDWRIIFLDTSKPEHPDGHLSNIQLEKLKGYLETNRHILIAMHHHPIPIHSEWMNNIGLQKPEAFLDIVKQHTNIKGVIFGHIHQEFDETHDNIRYLGSVSTCLQFNSNQDDMTISKLPPGYRAIELSPDGYIETSIHFIEKQ